VRGTLFAFFSDSQAVVRQWLVSGVSLNGPYVQLSGVNYTPLVYQGDTVPLPPRPLLPT
jgi:hypothetical protein